MLCTYLELDLRKAYIKRLDLVLIKMNRQSWWKVIEHYFANGSWSRGSITDYMYHTLD
jgi:hypothetical protein